MFGERLRGVEFGAVFGLSKEVAEVSPVDLRNGPIEFPCIARVGSAAEFPAQSRLIWVPADCQISFHPFFVVQATNAVLVLIIRYVWADRAYVQE